MIQNKPKFFKRKVLSQHPDLKSTAQFFSNPHYSLPLRLFLIIIGISFIILAIVLRRLPPAIPLYYSLPWGEDQLARPTDLFIIPFSILVIFILNLSLSMTFLKKDDFLIQFLMWSSCLIALAGTISIIKIILLVI